jgi:hypothetical protein
MTSSPLRFGFAFLAFALVTAAFAPPAVAGPDAEGSITITSATCEDIGLGGLCSGPLYVVTKTFQVFAGNNPDNPVPVAGNFTYVYTIANSPSSVAIFGALNELNVQTPPNGTTSYGFIDGAGVEPSSTAVATGDIRWRFDSPNINPGETSEQLYLISPFGPGEVDDTVIGVGNVFSIDTQATCVGPVVAPPALACTIGFWKNREDGKKGLLKFFEGADFDAVKAEAVSISTVFSTEAGSSSTSAPTTGPRSTSTATGPPIPRWRRRSPRSSRTSCRATRRSRRRPRISRTTSTMASA